MIQFRRPAWPQTGRLVVEKTRFKKHQSTITSVSNSAP